MKNQGITFAASATALAILVLPHAALASLVYESSIRAPAQGFGTAPRDLTLQATGQDPTESGGLAVDSGGAMLFGSVIADGSVYLGNGVSNLSGTGSLPSPRVDDAKYGIPTVGSLGITSANLRPEKTSLENLFSAMLALPAAPRNVYLFTDGWETQGNVERLLPSIAGSHFRLFPILPSRRPEIANGAVTKLVAPSHGNSGETVNLKIVLENHNDREVEGTIALTRNGQSVKSEAVRLKAGSQMFTYEVSLPEPSLPSYAASFKARRAELDHYEPDNQAIAWVTVRSKAKILLLNGQSGSGRYLEEILKRQGFEVHSRPADAPELALVERK